MDPIIQKLNNEKVYVFNTNDWFEQTSSMNSTEKGIFFELRYFLERNGYLPEETKRLARIANDTLEDFMPSWENIKHNFEGVFRKRRKSDWIIPPKHRGSFLDIENRPGVYAIRAFLGNPNLRRPVVYVGKAKNLHKRLSNHEIDKLLDENGIYGCCKIKYCDDPAPLETALIKKIRPIFNMQHNKIFVRNVYFNHVIGELHKKRKEITE